MLHFSYSLGLETLIPCKQSYIWTKAVLSPSGAEWRRKVKIILFNSKHLEPLLEITLTSFVQPQPTPDPMASLIQNQFWWIVMSNLCSLHASGLPTSRGGATPLQATWIKHDIPLELTHGIEFTIEYALLLHRYVQSPRKGCHPINALLQVLG